MKGIKPKSSFALALAILCSACVPSMSKFHIFELLGDNVHVIATGRSNVAGLYFDAEMPTQYEVSEGAHLLRILVSEDSYWPTLMITASSPTGKLLLGPGSVSSCVRFYHSPEFLLKEELRESIYVVWSSTFVCGGFQPEMAGAFSVKVYQPFGQYLGETTVKFKIATNGTVITYDAL